jgi:NhaP-type Na+/H+ or K+/H+ antiporter
MSVKVNYISAAGFKELLVIGIGLAFRSLGVVIATAFSRLNKREKLFCVIAYLPKATVQAALGAIPLSHGLEQGEVILALADISILFTAPLGAMLTSLFGSKLLKN